MNIKIVVLLVFVPMALFAQELPYQSIPDHSDTYSAGTVMARLVDGLGFRYYWATDSLSEENIQFRPNSEARSIIETMEHVYGLSRIIVNAVKQTPTLSAENDVFTYAELRKGTLKNLEEAATIMRRSSNKDFKKYNIVFGQGEQSTSYPFWYNINGPIADALWHVGQIVLLRRSAGNPLNSRVSVFAGRVRN